MNASNISKEYIEELQILHNKKTFGTASKLPTEIVNLMSNNKISSFLDFGCGKGNLSKTVLTKFPTIDLYSYDPVTSPIDFPDKVDLTFSSDVLEHVEPHEIDNTINFLSNITTKYQYHLIACHPAKKSLSDGRNAHLIIEDPSWWQNKFNKLTNWKIIKEETYETIANTKKIKNLKQLKYLIILEKI